MVSTPQNYRRLSCWLTPTAKEIAVGCGCGGKRTMLLGGAKNYLAVMEDADPDIFIDNFLNS